MSSYRGQYQDSNITYKHAPWSLVYLQTLVTGEIMLELLLETLVSCTLSMHKGSNWKPEGHPTHEDNLMP